jgi:ferric-dicitrate binding protein FerR (iron transport regulator)
MNLTLQTTLQIAGFVVICTASSCSNNAVTTTDSFEMVELPDGSIVYLNHNSSLEFDEDFEKREVNAEGELFFSVAEGEEPFVIKTEGGEVKVLGTEFSVKTTEDELEVEVEDGIVELKSGKFVKSVRKGQAAMFRDGDQAIRTLKAEFKFRHWMKALRLEFKTLGREFKGNSKQVGKESKKAGKKFQKELKSLKPDKK